jgi:hypothetical protein
MAFDIVEDIILAAVRKISRFPNLRRAFMFLYISVCNV